MGCIPTDKNVIQKLNFPLDIRIKQYQYTNSKMKSKASNKDSHIQAQKLHDLLHNLPHASDDILLEGLRKRHWTQVQSNICIKTMQQMNSKGISILVSYESSLLKHLVFRKVGIGQVLLHRECCLILSPSIREI